MSKQRAHRPDRDEAGEAPGDGAGAPGNGAEAGNEGANGVGVDAGLSSGAAFAETEAGESPEGAGMEPRPRIRSSRALDAAEIDACLRATKWGVLATIEDGGPYAVPVVFGYDGKQLYVASVAGRKMRNIDANPEVCLTIADVAPRMARWRSVLVRGQARHVRDPVGLAKAMRALRRNVAMPVTAQDLARLARARVFRIEAVELTGRATGW